MKNIRIKSFILVLFLIVIVLCLGFNHFKNNEVKNCSCKGIQLVGKVKEVKFLGESDLKVRIVSGYIKSDLKVKKTVFPSKCGEWNFVTQGEDFKIIFVTQGEDFTIKYVNDFPGQ